jgi:plasmid stabilization system protein ParE
MKRFKVIWTKNAELDLELIIEYIRINSISTAKKIFFEIKQESNKLHTLPKRKRVVPEFQKIGIVKYREIIYKRWRIIYKIDDEKVYVLLVADSSRNLEDILFQRLINSDNKE